MRARFIALPALLALAGCASTHEIDGGPRDGSVIAPADASTDASGDAGSPVCCDASAPPLPDDEPDVEPGARPVETPGEPWGAPPSIDRDEPCCEAGEVVALDDLTDDRDEHGPVRIVTLDREEWGLTWTTVRGESYDSAYRRIDASARPISERVDLGTGAWAGPADYGNHRLALVTWQEPGSTLFTADRTGGLRSRDALPDARRIVADVTRHPAVHGFALAATEPRDELPELRWLSVARDGAPVAQMQVAEVDGWFPPRVVSVGSRLVMVDPERIDLHVRVWADANLDPQPTLDLPDLGGAADATRFRDSVAIVLRRPRETGALLSLIVDPFDGRVLAGPTEVLPSDRHPEVALASDDVGGTIGLCFGATGADGGELRFVLLDPSGARLGASVRLAAGYQGVPQCSIARAGRDRYLVAWSNDRWVVHHTIHAVAVDVRR